MDIQETDDPVNGTNGTELGEILSTRGRKSTPARLKNFLDAYGKTGRLRRSLQASGLGHNTHYRKLQSDATYREAFERAEYRVGELLEDTALERALDGDNALLIALLKRFRPEAYRERVSAEVNVTVNLAERLMNARKRLIEMRKHDGTDG